MAATDRVACSCPSCGWDSFAPFAAIAAEGGGSRWQLVRCGDCASIVLCPRPADIASLYRGDYHVHRPRAGVGAWLSQAVARRTAARIARRLRPGSTILEIGCGTGELLDALRAHGHDVRGVEPSPAASAIARARGLDVVTGGYEDSGVALGSVELVVSAHVIEHLPDPNQLLRVMNQLLRTGGMGWIKSPLCDGWDMSWFGGHSGSCDVPYHLMIPSRSALERMIARAGFAEVQFTADPVPNDFVHGLRRWLGAHGHRFGFIRPGSPVFALALLPFSLVASVFGRPSRTEVWFKKVVGGPPGVTPEGVG